MVELCDYGFDCAHSSTVLGRKILSALVYLDRRRVLFCSHEVVSRDECVRCRLGEGFSSKKARIRRRYSSEVVGSIKRQSLKIPNGESSFKFRSSFVYLLLTTEMRF